MKLDKFSMTLAIFPKTQELSRPGKCIFKFHDFSGQCEPTCGVFHLTGITGQLVLVLATSFTLQHFMYHE